MTLASAVKAQVGLPLWITHLRQRLHVHRRLGLILGAGVSVDAGCPLWSELVKRLADRVPGTTNSMVAHRLAGVSEPYLTQILYHLHKAEVHRNASTVPDEYKSYQADSTWMQAVYEELYKDVVSKDFDELAQKHTYLSQLGELSFKSGFTVNFNFDDLVDEAAINYAEAQNEEAPEIIWRPRVETRRNAPVVFHINGYLPRESRRRRSDFLTFTEDAFAEVLISPNSVDAEFTMSRFATTTFLLLGNSLNDNSLKNMLRAGIKRNAANHHYIVYWEDDNKPRSSDERSHIFDVNLHVYNLISMFLTTDETKLFIELLNQPDEGAFEGEILKLSEILGGVSPTRRRYYLVGSVASGKSSNLEALRCFTTFEEWAGRTPAVLYQDHATLTDKQRAEIDNWIYGQLRLKNDRMRQTGPGIHIMDRGYLDLFAFSKDNSENIVKSDLLRDRVKSVTGPLEGGHVIFLEADADSLSERQARRGKLKNSKEEIDYDGAKLHQQGELLKKIYRPSASSVFNTSNELCDDTARKIARLILFGEYEPFDFERRIDEVKTSGGAP